MLFFVDGCGKGWFAVCTFGTDGRRMQKMEEINAICPSKTLPFPPIRSSGVHLAHAFPSSPSPLLCLAVVACLQLVCVCIEIVSFFFPGRHCNFLLCFPIDVVLFARNGFPPLNAWMMLPTVHNLGSVRGSDCREERKSMEKLYVDNVSWHHFHFRQL